MAKTNSHFGGSLKLATIFLTGDCNLACPYCYAREVPLETKDRWDVDTLGPLLDCLAKYEYKIAIGGGEPLMHPDLMIGVAREAVSRGMDISLLTNGYLLEEPILRTLREVGFHWVQVSADNLEDFNRIAPRLKKGRELGLRMAVGTVFLPQQLAGIKEMYHILKECQAVGWRILRYTPLNKHGALSTAPSNIEWIKYLCAIETELKSEWSSEPGKRHEQDPVQVRYEPSILPLHWLRSQPEENRPDICGGRQARRLFLYPDGQVYACGLPRRQGIFLGNYKTDPDKFARKLEHIPVHEYLLTGQFSDYCTDVCRGGCVQMRNLQSQTCDLRCEPENQLVPVCCFEKFMMVPGRHINGPVILPSTLYREITGQQI